MEMQKITLQNLKKGIKTAQNRINKGLEGKKLAYALRYIKGAKTRIRKIKKELNKSAKIIKKVANAVKGIFKNVINKIEEIKKERDFIKRWEDIEEWDKWKEWNE